MASSVPRLIAVISAAILCFSPSVRGETGEPQDLFAHLLDANRAQLVVLVEQELMAPPLAGQLARALDEIEAAAQTPDARSYNYLLLEAQLIERIGPQASNIHLGRSRNDLGAAMNRMVLRERMLQLMETLAGARSTLGDLAADHTGTIIPGFTHGVQAQPTTLAHYLLALDAHLARDAARYEAVYHRLNQSPLGAAVFTGSGFPLDRDRLAGLLGFDGLVENTYDAIVLSTGDSKAEITHAASLSALAVGRFAQDLLFQYDDPAPGLVLEEAATGHSSIMPQKRNPRLIEQLRVSASEVGGGAVTVMFYVHNTPLHEVRDTRLPLLYRTDAVLAETVNMYALLETVLGAIAVRPEALRARVDADYATMTELADTLYRAADVPFRKGYAFASALTSYGRAAGKTPSQIAWQEARTIYLDTHGEVLPIGPEVFAAAIDPARMIAKRKARGGPQAEAIARLIAQSRADRAARDAFLSVARQELAAADERLSRAVEALKN